MQQTGGKTCAEICLSENFAETETSLEFYGKHVPRVDPNLRVWPKCLFSEDLHFMHFLHLFVLCITTMSMFVVVHNAKICKNGLYIHG